MKFNLKNGVEKVYGKIVETLENDISLFEKKGIEITPPSNELKGNIYLVVESLCNSEDSINAYFKDAIIEDDGSISVYFNDIRVEFYEDGSIDIVNDPLYNALIDAVEEIDNSKKEALV